MPGLQATQEKEQRNATLLPAMYSNCTAGGNAQMAQSITAHNWRGSAASLVDICGNRCQCAQACVLLPISQSTVCQREATPGAKCESQRGAFNGMAGVAEKEDKKVDQHQPQVQRYAGIHADSNSQVSRF